MLKLYVLSGGQVQPNDFYDLPPLPEVGAPAQGPAPLTGAADQAAPGGCAAVAGAPALPSPVDPAALAQRRASRSRAGRKAAHARWRRFYARQGAAAEPEPAP